MREARAACEISETTWILSSHRRFSVLGLAFGSFLNVCIYRLPLGLSVVTPRSACPKCKKPIAFYDNIPVLSWLILARAVPPLQGANFAALSDDRIADWRAVSGLLLVFRAGRFPR